MIMEWEAPALAHFSSLADPMTATQTHQNLIRIACAAMMMRWTQSQHCGMHMSVSRDVKIMGGAAWASAFTEGWDIIDIRFALRW